MAESVIKRNIPKRINNLCVSIFAGTNRIKARVVTNESSISSHTEPYALLIIGYRCLFIASAVSAFSDISNLGEIFRESAFPTLDNGVITLGTEANRQYMIIHPSNVELYTV